MLEYQMQLIIFKTSVINLENRYEARLCKNESHQPGFLIFIDYFLIKL